MHSYIIAEIVTIIAQEIMILEAIYLRVAIFLNNNIIDVADI